MHKKGIVLLSSLFLLAVCGEVGPTESDSEKRIAEPKTEVEAENETDAETTIKPL